MEATPQLRLHKRAAFFNFPFTSRNFIIFKAITNELVLRFFEKIRM
jgi:hypothetical protein